MHPRGCRCGECRVVAREEARAGQQIYRLFKLGPFRPSFREANQLWVSAIKEERWETLDPGQSRGLEAQWNSAPDSVKKNIKELCDVVLS